MLEDGGLAGGLIVEGAGGLVAGGRGRCRGLAVEGFAKGHAAGGGSEDAGDFSGVSCRGFCGGWCAGFFVEFFGGKSGIGQEFVSGVKERLGGAVDAAEFPRGKGEGRQRGELDLAGGGDALARDVEEGDGTEG